ncbi:MAG: phage tail fiber protein, partial [Bacilli bacterium]|nr:phage tail fiber protein [Bacilli bacterium]
MVNSYVYYTGDGSTDNFQITFDYLSKEFVQVYLDGTLLEVEADYIFSGDRTILIPSIPPSGSIVFIQRVTSKNRLVEFRDASILVANDLDISALQAIHIAEEANDNIQNVIQADPNGNFDALNRRLVNVDDPVDDTDGANKLYVDTRFAADVSAAVTARDDALAFASAAQGYRNAAQVSATTAVARAQDSASSAVAAAQSAQEAQ